MIWPQLHAGKVRSKMGVIFLNRPHFKRGHEPPAVDGHVTQLWGISFGLTFFGVMQQDRTGHMPTVRECTRLPESPEDSR